MTQKNLEYVRNRFKQEKYHDLLCQVATIPEAAKIWKISQGKLKRWCQEGKVAAAQYGDNKTWIVALGSVRDRLDKKSSI